MTYEGLVTLNYRLERKLGEGGFGAVYLARHVELGRKVACKILHREWADKPEVVDRFFREARAVCEIGHRSIIEIENFGRLPQGEPFYLMEFFPGESLAQRIRRAPLTNHEVAVVFEPVASALAAAHAKQIIHRDLKPENIMLLEDAGRVVEVKLLDFGIAKLAGDADGSQSRSGTALGTPSYMAPEQARDSKKVDVRADVYSFAATLFAAIAGRPPFEGDSVASVLVKVQLEPPASLASFVPRAPVGLQQVLERCMDKDPDRRPRTISEAWQAIAQVLATAPPTSGVGVAATLAADAPTPVPAVTTLGGSVGESIATRGSRRWAYAVPVLVLAAVAGFVVWQVRDGTPPPDPLVAAVSIDAATPTTVDASVATPPVDAADLPDAPLDAAAIAPPPPVRPSTDPSCAPRRFAIATPTNAEIDKALERLRACRTSGGVTQRQFDELQQRIVAKRPKTPADPPPPPPEPSLDCSTASFSNLVDKPNATKAELDAALGRLERCKARMSDQKYQQLRQNLMSRWLRT